MNKKTKSILLIVIIISIIGIGFLISQKVNNMDHFKNHPIFSNTENIGIKNNKFISNTRFNNSLNSSLTKKSEIKLIDNVSISKNQDLTKYSNIDLRSFQHGIDILQLDNFNYISIWSSSGLIPKGENKENEWTHDVYYSKFNISNPKICPLKIISAPGAQEPASSTITENKHIIITMEDDYNVKNDIAQTFGVYDLNMKPIKKYQNIVYDGGHSGHIASMKNYFIIFYSEGWIDNGGVDNLGSGDDVMLSTFDSKGDLLFKKDVAVGDNTRDWWPLISGSKNNTLLVWQRFIDNENYAQLIFRIYNPKKNTWITSEQLLKEKISYYNYDVQYLDDLGLYLITGNSDLNIGFAYTISPSGKIISKNNNLPQFVRESQPAIIKLTKNLTKVVYPTMPSRLGILEISKSKINLISNENINYNWSYIGTDGIFLNENKIYFLTLSPDGLVEIKINLK